MSLPGLGRQKLLSVDDESRPDEVTKSCTFASVPEWATRKLRVAKALTGFSIGSFSLPIADRFDGIFKLAVLVCPCCLPIEFNEFVGFDGCPFKNRTFPCVVGPGG